MPAFRNGGEPPLRPSGPDELLRPTPSNAEPRTGRAHAALDDRSRCPRSTRLASSRCTKNTRPNTRPTPQARQPTGTTGRITSRACHRPTLAKRRTAGGRTR
jgi:hypothetical protein